MTDIGAVSGNNDVLSTLSSNSEKEKRICAESGWTDLVIRGVLPYHQLYRNSFTCTLQPN